MRRSLILALATLGTVAVGVSGCSITGGQTCKEAREGSAQGEPCSVIRWHESHEGPTVYNNFHGTQ